MGTGVTDYCSPQKVCHPLGFHRGSSQEETQVHVDTGGGKLWVAETQEPTDPQQQGGLVLEAEEDLHPVGGPGHIP